MSDNIKFMTITLEESNGVVQRITETKILCPICGRSMKVSGGFGQRLKISNKCSCIFVLKPSEKGINCMVMDEKVGKKVVAQMIPGDYEVYE